MNEGNAVRPGACLHLTCMLVFLKDTRTGVPLFWCHQWYKPNWLGLASYMPASDPHVLSRHTRCDASIKAGQNKKFEKISAFFKGLPEAIEAPRRPCVAVKSLNSNTTRQGQCREASLRCFLFTYGYSFPQKWFGQESANIARAVTKGGEGSQNVWLPTGLLYWNRRLSPVRGHIIFCSHQTSSSHICVGGKATHYRRHTCLLVAPDILCCPSDWGSKTTEAHRCQLLTGSVLSVGRVVRHFRWFGQTRASFFHIYSLSLHSHDILYGPQM